jgi:hypothetical protein
VDVEIHPEPSPEERAAIEEAVAVLYDRKRPTGSAWWRAGLSDAADEADD